MPRFLADENFNRDVLSAVISRLPGVDLWRVQDIRMDGAADEALLEWAAKEGRVMISHDEQTMIGFADWRIRRGLPMPGLLIVPWSTPHRIAIDALVTMLGAGSDQDFDNLVQHLPQVSAA